MITPPRRRWFSFSLRTMLAAVTGAAVGLAILRVVITKPSLNQWFTYALVGPSPGLAYLLWQLGADVEWIVNTMRVTTVLTLAAYGVLLSHKPNWKTAVFVLVFHVVSGLIVGVLLLESRN